MKKLIFSNYDDTKNPYYGGGGAVAVHEVAKYLAQFYDVTVLTGNYPSAQTRVIDHVKYERLGWSWLPPHLAQFMYSLSLPWQVVSRQFDLWVESFTPPFSTSFLPLFTRRPVIGLCHFLLASEKARQYHLPFDLIERFGLQFYHHFIALTSHTEKYIRQVQPNADVTIIPNGIHPQTCPPTTTPQPGYILFLGRLEMKQKGLDLLLHAYQRISSQLQLPLYIAGNGLKQDEAELRTMIHDLHLSKHVKLLGRVEGDAKKRLFCGATALALPSRYETLSLTALEALSYQVPMICFNIPGLEWLDNAATYKADAFSIESYAHGLLEVATNTALRKRLVTNAQKLSTLYTWQNISQQYLKYIQSILGHSIS